MKNLFSLVSAERKRVVWVCLRWVVERSYCVGHDFDGIMSMVVVLGAVVAGPWDESRQKTEERQQHRDCDAGAEAARPVSRAR